MGADAPAVILEHAGGDRWLCADPDPETGHIMLHASLTDGGFTPTARYTAALDGHADLHAWLSEADLDDPAAVMARAFRQLLAQLPAPGTYRPAPEDDA